MGICWSTLIFFYAPKPLLGTGSSVCLTATCRSLIINSINFSHFDFKYYYSSTNLFFSVELCLGIIVLVCFLEKTSKTEQLQQVLTAVRPDLLPGCTCIFISSQILEYNCH